MAKIRHIALSTQDPDKTAKFYIDVFGLKPADLKLMVIKPDEVAALTGSGKIDCVVVFGVPAEPEVGAVVYAVDAKKKEPPTILAVDIGDFLNANSPCSTPGRC